MGTRSKKATARGTTTGTGARKTTAAKRKIGMNGLSFDRQHTKAGVDPLDTIEWTLGSSAIKNTDGSVVFSMTDVEVPADFSAARHRHRRLEVLPQGRRPRHRPRGLGAPGRPPRRQDRA